MSARTPPTLSIVSDRLRFVPENDQFWSQVAEARLQALPQSSSASSLLRELESSQRAHEVLAAELKRRIRAVNGRIGGLPLEILALVFWWLSVLDPMGEVDVDALSESDSDDSEDVSEIDEAEDEEDEDGSEYAWSYTSSELSSDISIAYTLGWVRGATHVCHLWREVALSHAGLWATIPVHLSAPWVKALLERSKQAPLTMLFTGEEADESYLELENIHWVSRARHIVYHLPSTGRLAEVLRIFPAPLLRRLDIINSHDAFPVWALEWGSFGALESLSIHDISHFPRWSDGNRLAQLTSLQLGTITLSMMNGNPPEFTPVAEDLIVFLDSLQNLEALEIYGYLPTVIPAHFTDVATVTLPRLRRVALAGLYKGCAFFLQHVITSPDASFHVDYFDVAFQTIDELAFSRFTSHTPFETLSITCIILYAFELGRDLPEGHDHLPSLTHALIGGNYAAAGENASEDTDPSFGDGSPSDFDIWISLTPQKEVRKKKSWVQAIFHSICMDITLERVRTLSLDLDSSLNAWSTSQGVDGQRRSAPMWDTAQWIEILSGAHNLWHLKVVSKPSNGVRGCSAVVDLLHALGTTTGFLSNLQVLDLVDLDPDYGRMGSFTAIDPFRDASQYLHALLATRPGVSTVNVIRRDHQSYKEKWRSRDWIEKEELGGRVCFADYALDC
ncbi:hypothetical protein PENSPDRAFT_141422 [Peniophora sp. CONT]|nr:hypothetical protein PENSPDRAFT_141422 [Peniophora sp. CONT]